MDKLEEIKVILDKRQENKLIDDYELAKWEKNGNSRMYIKMIQYGSKTAKGNVIECGYVDLIKNEYVGYSQYKKQWNLLTNEFK